MDSVKIAGWIAVGVSLVLVARVLLIDNPEAIIIIAPALIGGVAVVAWPWRRSTLVAALVLIGATAVYSLIGWIGFLYLPSLVLVPITFEMYGIERHVLAPSNVQIDLVRSATC